MSAHIYIKKYRPASSELDARFHSEYHRFEKKHTHAILVWYISLHEWLLFNGFHVGKYTINGMSWVFVH